MIPPGLSNCKYRNSSHSISNLTSARAPRYVPEIWLSASLTGAGHRVSPRACVSHKNGTAKRPARSYSACFCRRIDTLRSSDPG